MCSCSVERAGDNLPRMGGRGRDAARGEYAECSRGCLPEESRPNRVAEPSDSVGEDLANNATGEETKRPVWAPPSDTRSANQERLQKIFSTTAFTVGTSRWFYERGWFLRVPSAGGCNHCLYHRKGDSCCTRRQRAHSEKESLSWRTAYVRAAGAGVVGVRFCGHPDQAQPNSTSF